MKLLVLIVFLGCASPKILYDYDDQVDFNQYKTFQFYNDVLLNINEIEANRILTQLEKSIIGKGLELSNQPAIFVDVQLKQFEAPRNSVGIGFGNYGRHSGISLGGQVPINANTLTKQFTVDFVDAKTDKLIWRGFYEGDFQTNIRISEKEQLLAEAFQKLLSKYPPKKR
ncbi:MAG: DUF4136 domain-containing protein [Lutibacter sp.]|nr:DUF4136 domain-containing protein [Lutibacter sp.]